MDIRDIMAEPTGVKRPDHPDFWKLSETILALKADMEETQGDFQEQQRRWRAQYEAVGDFDSIAYCAIQAAFQIHGIETGADWQRVVNDSTRHHAYVATVQAFFDGFIMGAKLQESRNTNA